MNRVRMGEIALMRLKAELARDGIRLEDAGRRIGQEAKQIGISTDEATRFAHTLVQEMVDEAFSKSKR